MPSYEHRGKNSYRLTVETEASINQERGRERRTVKVPEGLTPKKQKEWLDSEWYKFKDEVESGAYIAPDKMIFSTFVEEWKTNFAEEKYAPKTISLNDFLFNYILPHFGNKRMSEIKTMHIVHYFKEIQAPGKRNFGRKNVLSSSTLNSLHRLLKSIFKTAVIWRVIKQSPMDGLTYPKKIVSKAEYYNEDECMLLLKALEKEPNVWTAIVMLAITTGLRSGEICGLEWRHFNAEKSSISVEQQRVYTKKTNNITTDPKSDNGKRTVRIPSLVVSLLKAVRKESVLHRSKLGSTWKGGEEQFIFTTLTGAPFSSGKIYQRWTTFLKRKKLKHIKFHSLRHTSASLLIANGFEAKIISDRLGHSDIKITMNVYGHVSEKVDQKAADAFDDIFGKKTN